MNNELMVDKWSAEAILQWYAQELMGEGRVMTEETVMTATLKLCRMLNNISETMVKHTPINDSEH